MRFDSFSFATIKEILPSKYSSQLKSLKGFLSEFIYYHELVSLLFSHQNGVERDGFLQHGPTHNPTSEEFLKALFL